MNSVISEVENPATLRIARIALLHPEKVASLLGVTEGTLAVWRTTRRYPLRWIKVGRVIRYRLEDVERFIALRTHEGDDITKATYLPPEDAAKRKRSAPTDRPRSRRARAN